MDIDALRSFLAFVETGSFTRAAKQINRTQSAFSAQMRKLEDELHVSLFEKEGRNLVLSEAGMSLRAHAEKLVSLHNQAVKQVKRYENKRPLRLDVQKTITIACCLKSSAYCSKPNRHALSRCTVSQA